MKKNIVYLAVIAAMAKYSLRWRKLITNNWCWSDKICINQSDNATIYRNVTAVIYGLDYEASYKWSDNWRSNFTAAYVNANNTTDDRAIAQTPPLEGTVISIMVGYLEQMYV